MRSFLYRGILLACLATHGLSQRQVFFGHNQHHSHVGHYVTLSWSQSGYITGNNVYRGTQDGGPYTQIFSSGFPITAYVDNGCLGTCFYVVTAVNPNGESAYSDQATAVVP